MLKPSASITLQKEYPYSPFLPQEFDAALHWAAENGFAGVEIAICNPSEVNADKLYHQISDLGLAFVTIATGQAYGLEGLSLTDPDATVRERTVERIMDHVRLSAAAGSPKVTIGSLRGVCLGPDPEETLQHLAEGLMRCAQFAYQNGVTLNFEPINRAETEILRTCPETLSFFARYLNGCPGIGILLDTYHSACENRDPAEDALLVGEKISHVHFSDKDRKLPGFGGENGAVGIDFCAVVAALKKAGYNGFVSLETKNIPDTAFARAHAAKALKDLLK